MRLYDIYLLLIRLFLGYVFASAGLCKLTAGQFGQLIGPPTADMLPGLEGIWQFLAASQVLVGALVLSGRWSLAGLLALLPLNVGILAYTIGNHWTGTPFINGLLVVLNLVALAAEWPSLRFLLLPDAPAPAAAPRLVRLWPGWRPALLTLALLGVAALIGVLGGPFLLTGALGTLGFAVAWAHGLRVPGLHRVERVALALPGLAVVGLSAVSTLPLAGRHSMFGLLAAGVLGGIAAGLVPVGYRLWLRRPPRPAASA